ncbi:MAG: hypothetical protein ACFE0P_08950 [Oceanicaulis sp.]
MFRHFALFAALIFVTACSSNTHTHGVFDADPDGLRQAGAMMLAHADAREGRLTALNAAANSPRPYGSFWPAEDLAELLPYRRDMMCRSAGLEPDCDITRAVEAVLVPPQAPGEPVRRFPATPEGARAALAAAGPRAPGDPYQITPAVVLIRPAGPQRIDPARAVDVDLSWVSFDPHLINRDFACNAPRPFECWRREDILRFAIFPDAGGGAGVERLVGDDLAADYAAVQAQLAGRPAERIHAEVANRGDHRGWEARIGTVERIEDDRFCGHMAFEGIHRPGGEACLAFAEIDRFVVRITEAGPPPRAADIALFPFRFLGALGVATAMGGAGG